MRAGMAAMLAEHIFMALTDGHLRTAVCVGLARVALSPSDYKDPWVYVHAIFLGVLAAANAERLPDIESPLPPPPYGWQDYAPFLAASVFSYVIGLRLLNNWLHDCALAFVLAPVVWLAVAEGFIGAVLRCVCACSIGIGITRLPAFQNGGGEGIYPPSLRWGVAGAVSSVSFVWLPACAAYVLPIEEILMGYAAVEHFIDARQLRAASLGVLIASAHIQLSLGFLGLWYLRQSQLRKNGLLSIGRAHPGRAVRPGPAEQHKTGDRGRGGRKKSPRPADHMGDARMATVDPGQGSAAGVFLARDFARTAVRFMVVVALPYLVFRTFMEAIDSLNISRFSQGMTRKLRLSMLADGGASLEVAARSNYTIAAYAGSLDSVINKCFALVTRKLFSLPKLMLIPAIVAQQPLMSSGALPVFLLVDAAKCRFVASVTVAIEALQQTSSELESKRSKVETHDASHARAIQDLNAGAFTHDQWRVLSESVESTQQRKRALELLRGYVRWLYWSDILTPGIEVAIAWLLQTGQIDAGAIWVYARSLEDGIDALLTRSRAEAELAALSTDVQRLEGLHAALVRAPEDSPIACAVGGGELRLEAVGYERGAARVHVSAATFRPGHVVAITGANGSGKSSLLALVHACARDGRLPLGLLVTNFSAIAIPSADVVQVPQKPYCPQHAAPLAWLAHGARTHTAAGEHGLMPAAGASAKQPERLEDKVAMLGRRLTMWPNANASDYTAWVRKMGEEHADYCSTLSGGQLVKLELIRSVFLRRTCPAILLLDETLAPLDPESKATVQRMLRQHCQRSLILVVFHHDAAQDGAHDSGLAPATAAAAGPRAGAPPGQGHDAPQGSASRCVKGQGFFTHSLHFDGAGAAVAAEVC